MGRADTFLSRFVTNVHELRWHFISSLDFSLLNHKMSSWSLWCLLVLNRENLSQLTQVEVTQLHDSWGFWLLRPPAWVTPISFGTCRVGIRNLHGNLKIIGWRNSGTVRLCYVQAGTNPTHQGQYEPAGKSCPVFKETTVTREEVVTNKQCSASIFCTQHWDPRKKSNCFSDVERRQRPLPFNMAHCSLYIS